MPSPRLDLWKAWVWVYVVGLQVARLGVLPPDRGVLPTLLSRPWALAPDPVVGLGWWASAFLPSGDSGVPSCDETTITGTSISDCQVPICGLTCTNALEARLGHVLDWSLERGQKHMTYTVGETVVYPNHGAAVIEDIEMRTIKGEERQYLVLRIVAQQDLVVKVPSCNLDLVGVRDVVDKDGLDRVFGVLRAIVPDEPTNWSRRYKANLEKLHSGDVMKCAEVVRDLWRREQERGLSAGEKRMLAKARQVLVSEVALAEDTPEDKAEALLDEVLAS